MPQCGNSDFDTLILQPLTKFADSDLVNRLDKAFGGRVNLIGFGFWFN